MQRRATKDIGVQALPVLPASGAGTTGGPETYERDSTGFWPTGATGLWPVPPAGAGTTGARRRYHRQGRETTLNGELSVANLNKSIMATFHQIITKQWPA